MKAPSSGCPDTASGRCGVMSVWMATLSSGQPRKRAVTCITAVTNAMGLNKAETQTEGGVTRSVCHLKSWSTRSTRLGYHDPRADMLGYATFSQLGGMRSRKSESDSASMASEMLRAPSRPSLSSLRERRISPRSSFMRSHSCSSTTRKGVFSAMRELMSIIEKSAGARSSRSAIFSATMASLPPPSPPPAAAPCSSSSVRNSVSDSADMKPISALGCRPNSDGDSVGRVVRMYAKMSVKLPSAGAGKSGHMSAPASRVWLSSTSR
mmetsp:Transcript_13770/g.31949  ORF Transcript_13770/g.31949 Transcript_13770/m.31949 type:complete len:266 (-) Transcript_13770:51-848(-)